MHCLRAGYFMRTDRPLRRPIQSHREERQSYENPDKRQGGNSLIGPS